ncbi:HPt (histidine-containing phosphotransfer) domain-containing protein [Litorivivens lipolytica]|uniref:HPt (Histidine-containing phosphotransfer) domain-containing protein n=1 Tax=Litorivivens lipolytica TaxID=1524264 RepID=A0A7W4W891_9GAMM|nr:Hpt domain-containing protein [Litorivivens lipolytica]MBB3048704.1 HPt (histidine-containing phosphotransfer) domain-containing protein [Litorivivens lipolytica]
MLSRGVEHSDGYRELSNSALDEFSTADYRALLEVYLDVMPKTVAALEQACEEDNAAKAAATLHKLKSNTSYICDSDLPNCCDLLERQLLSVAGNDATKDIQLIISRCRILLDEIATYLKS